MKKNTLYKDSLENKKHIQPHTDKVALFFEGFYLPQGLQRSNFLEAVSDVSIRRYFTQLYAVGLSVYFYLCVHLLTNLNQCKLSANTA